jgi:hypothetical protein
MTHTFLTRWTRKELALILAIVIFVCAVVLLLLSLAPSKPLPSADLGAEWQCSKTLFMTTCTPTRHAEAGLQASHKGAMCLRRA